MRNGWSEMHDLSAGRSPGLSGMYAMGIWSSKESIVSIERLDPRAIDKVSGPAWREVRPSFDRLNEALLAVSPTTKGELTTIYVKYAGPETDNQPYGVLWIKKASELILGLALPDDVKAPELVKAPRGCKYAGLTKYVVLKPGDEVPDEIADWVKMAYDNLKR